MNRKLGVLNKPVRGPFLSGLSVKGGNTGQAVTDHGRDANEGICAFVEGRLIERSPQHRTFIRTLGWIERGFITSYWSYRMSHNQFGQWQKNERMLAGLQAAPAPLPAAVR